MLAAFKIVKQFTIGYLITLKKLREWLPLLRILNNIACFPYNIVTDIEKLVSFVSFVSLCRTDAHLLRTVSYAEQKAFRAMRTQDKVDQYDR